MTSMNNSGCITPRAKPRARELVLAFLTWLAADMTAGLAIAAAAFLSLRRHGHLTPKQIAEVLPTDFTFLVATTTAAAIVALAVLWRYRSTPKAYFAFFPAVPRRALGLAALSGIAVVAIELAAEAALSRGFGLSLTPAPSETAILPKSWTDFGIVLVCLALIVPFFEEVLFRGYVFGWLQRKLPLWAAIAASAAVSAAAHGLYLARGGFSGWFGTGEIFVIGVVLAWAAARTGSLRTSTVLHAAINATSFTVAFLA